MAALRERTKQAHAATEAAVDIKTALRSEADYLHLLGQFYGYWAPYEARVAEALVESGAKVPGMDGRWRTAMLAQDIRALGGDPDRIPTAKVAAIPGSLADLAGRLYVTEGSTLGGQVITKLVSGRFPLHAGEPGLLFFTGDGEGTRQRWITFGTWVDEAIPAADSEACITAANETFRAIEAWFTETKATPAV